MDLFLGMLLVLGMMSLIFMGPEWVGALARERRDEKKSAPPS